MLNYMPPSALTVVNKIGLRGAAENSMDMIRYVEIYKKLTLR